MVSQGRLPFPRRKKPGRKRTKNSPEPHRSREVFTRRRVLHVRLLMKDDVPNLRRKRSLWRVLSRAFSLGCSKPGFRICQFSIQTNHIHMVVEADNHVALSKGMQGFSIRLAKTLNTALNRKGQVLRERYRVTHMATPTQVRHTLAYVLNNARRHGADIEGADPLSSARYFLGFAQPISLPLASAHAPRPVAPPQTDLLKSRWRFIGLIDVNETPGPLRAA